MAKRLSDHPAPEAPVRSAKSGRVGCAPHRELGDITRHLELILAVLSIARQALEHQAADADLDVAATLRCSAIDPLAAQIERLRQFP